MNAMDGAPQYKVRQLTAAMEHLEARRWRLAEVQCRVLLTIDRNDVEAMLILGLSVAASGEAARAAPILEKVRRARPNHADPCQDLATMQPRVPRSVVARQYRACLRLAPNDAKLRHGFAYYLLENAEADAALAALRDAPDSPATFNLRGMALAELGKYKDAARSFDQAARLDPSSPGSWANLGMMLRIEGWFEESTIAYDKAVARAGNDVQIKVYRAIALLHAGRWLEGWREYEWRFSRPGHGCLSEAPVLPTLEPAARLDGTRIIVWHEEGFGDTLQFARYLPILAALGAAVTAVVPAALVRVLRGIPGIAVVQTGDGPLPDHDYQCSFISLPRVFATLPRDVPGAPYLAADAALAKVWAARLPRDGLRTGLVWAGQARPWLQGFTSFDHRRSLALKAFAPLAAVRGARFVSLQAGTPAAQGQEPPLNMELTDPMESVHDFADTAAIIANLDVVITVDTSVAHLAGAMGKPVFLLDRYDNCWRWQHGRADTPWYPTMTIFRQQRPGDWPSVMQRVAASLSAMITFRGIPAQVPISTLANAA